MQIGFAVPISGSWATPQNAAALGSKAEALGYSSLWTFQRLLSPLGPDDRPLLEPQYRSVHDPLALLGYLAGRTTSVRLGVGVVNVPYYAPIVLAKILSTLDHCSEGRLDVGLGIGWLAQEMDAVGVSSAARGARAEDFLACLRAIWTEEVVDYAGPYYRVPRCRVEPRPLQSPHPPILMGGAVEPALRRAGRAADGWISSSRADLASIAEAAAVVRSAARQAGRDPEAVRIVCRGVVKVRRDERAPLVGSLEEIRADLEDLAAAGVTETFIDLNFDPQIGSPEADPVASLRRAHEALEALAPH